MKKPTKKSAFTLLESSMSIVITTVVVGAAASMTVVTAKLTRSSARNISSASGGQVALQRLLQDVRDADAVISGFKLFTLKLPASSTFLPLRVPSVDAAGRPLPGQFDVVTYYTTVSGGSKFLWRAAIHCSSGFYNYSGGKFERLGRVGAVDFKYFGFSPMATVKSISSGEFDGQASVDPAIVVKAPNVSGASYVEAHITFKDTSGSQEYFSGALLRNNVL